jgi:uncharacterized protein (DUF2147 family)
LSRDKTGTISAFDEPPIGLKRKVGVAMGAIPARLILASVVLALTVTRLTAEPTVVGLWEEVDENTGKAESWFRITEHNGVYDGTIVKMFLEPGEDPNWTCDKCEGADRGKPVLGLTLIKGMRRNGNHYEGGTITDPRDGNVYRALMELSPDGQKLEMRGYLGISLFGRSQIWNRLPDTALQSQSPRSGSRTPASKKK